ncbi:N-acetyltransferase [Amorphus sp. 3PC139-8]|uniref:N-acetyltransferase n=1 Tax=Amorphus sp. 3PC139-8 TaxID=2735676 RepID=UPI00345D1356
MDLNTVKIAPLASKDSVRRFHCGVSEIDNWAKEKAYKWHDQGRVRVFCAHEAQSSSPSGFYVLTFSSENSEKIDYNRWGATKTQAVPLLYIHYLAIQRSCQRSGLGGHMLVDALHRAYIVSNHVAFYGVALRSLNEDTTKLYSRYGFKIAPKEKNHPLMVLPIWSIKDLFQIRN